MRAGAVTAQFEVEFESVRNGPRRLNHREIVALSRRAYDSLVRRFDDDPGEAARWARAVTVWGGTGQDDGAPFDDDMEAVFGDMLNWVLDPAGPVPTEQFPDLIREVSRSIRDAAARLNRAADGNHSPDPAEQRFPEVRGSAATLQTLFDRWTTETGPAPSTLKTTRGIVTSLQRHVGQVPLSALTPEIVVAWKDDLLV